MKITNENLKFPFQVLFTMLLIGLFFSLFLFIIGEYKIKPIIALILLAVSGAYILFKITGTPYFTYDSDGETLLISNKRFNLFNPATKELKRIELPKKKISSFKIKNYFIRKKLEIIIKSKSTKSGFSKFEFDMTYLSNDSINKMKRSLTKIIKKNTQTDKGSQQ